jgi:hypothetical protein
LGGSERPAELLAVENVLPGAMEANRIIGDSGLGAALAPTLLEEVKYWPSRCQRQDFQQHVNFPASDISGSTETDASSETKTSRIHFSYGGSHYSLIFIDQGMNQWATDDLCVPKTLSVFID